MKQGRASRDVFESWKKEPIPHKQSEVAVSRIGNAIGGHVTDDGERSNQTPPINGPRGFAAPRSYKVDRFKAGGQGRH